ncbi:hypothetical protein [Ramlibacter tataouinensis]|uniref:Transcriptional regulator n=1 Tax=Ramlibacter tataouinensis (strain ATCC BAA-407 / DSM 14655 / LMG 21543 / TTB310) TaxID=365046 RepID=F5Y6B9_RAMTT|nr:hypothetical protein [Ramlibacter tataouinensis]AEG92805.1 hypothetical protein Rta_17150 [Ramlibacter tataouinensis TTB310]
MAASELPPDIRRFILTSVPSVPYLEALLLLRARPQQAWEASDIARRLYLGERQVQELLQALVGNGVASAVPMAEEQKRGYIYQPVSTELAQMLDRLATTYVSNLVPVTDLIHSRIDKRAQQFADAFRWRKDSK